MAEAPNAGSFGSVNHIAAGANGQRLVLAQLNRDKRADVAISGDRSEIAVVVSTRRGWSSPAVLPKRRGSLRGVIASDSLRRSYTSIATGNITRGANDRASCQELAVHVDVKSALATLAVQNWSSASVPS